MTAQAVQDPAIIIQTTVSNEDDAARLAALLLTEKLAACVQEQAIRSHYRWDGKVQCDAEILLRIKTRSTLEARVIAFIEQHHPYDLPEIICVPVTGGSETYLAWVADETKR